VALALPTYETDQLVSMIGSKRPLVGQLRVLLAPLMARKGPTRFLDPFCGSGAVSRLARGMGMQVMASDLEPFSFILNHVYLTLRSDDLVPMFTEMGGIDAYLSMLNLHGLFAAETGGGMTEPYLSRHYAPQETENPDLLGERLFFTAENARFLDAVREEIEHSWEERRISATEKTVVLASILYEASRRANTSGTFTAYHKDLLGSRSRIMQRCQLQAPLLPDEEVAQGEMHLCDAATFVKSRSADICFLDPPASVHQYGSAYHLLNSIAVWDRYAPSGCRDGEGRLSDRAGIRSDWKSTYSPFCSLKHADAAFIHLFGAIDARHIVLTYPASSLVSSERIVELLRARHDPVTVIPLQKRNQGGRQAKDGKQQIEQVFITGKSDAFSVPVGSGVDRLPLIRRLDALASAVFARPMEVPPFSFLGNVMLENSLPVETLLQMPLETLARRIGELERSVCSSGEQALHVLLSQAANMDLTAPVRAKLVKRSVSLVRSMAREVGVGRLKEIVMTCTAPQKVLEVMDAIAYHATQEE